jgi:hypothetical protein
LNLFFAGVPSNPIPKPFFFCQTSRLIVSLLDIVVAVVFAFVLVLPLFRPLFQALKPDAETMPYPSFLEEPNVRRRAGPGGEGINEREGWERPVGVVSRCDMSIVVDCE